mgnify:CR=1 FL=1
MTLIPLPIRCLPGIKRDGTQLEGNFYIDGKWMRFQRGLPRKIWGYTSNNKYLREISRALNVYMANSKTYVHSGSANYIERLFINEDGTTSIITEIGSSSKPISIETPGANSSH